jgi:hypothetical protein
MATESIEYWLDLAKEIATIFTLYVQPKYASYLEVNAM